MSLWPPCYLFQKKNNKAKTQGHADINIRICFDPTFFGTEIADCKIPSRSDLFEHINFPAKLD
jgi:hypothetical protein